MRTRARSLVPAFDAAVLAHDRDPASRRAEHLAEYSFRFDDCTAASPFAVPRPMGDGPWTLAQTLQEIRLRGASVIESTRGLRVRHAHRLPGLAQAVRLHEDAVRLWLSLGQPVPRQGWDDETELHRLWMSERLAASSQPVLLRPGVSITDWARFATSVHERAEAGPDAPCASGLRRDLADLFSRYAVLGPQPQAERRPARAA